MAAAAARISSASAAPPKITGWQRYALNNLRIRTRLVALLVLPVIAAIVLGALRIDSALQNETSLTKVSELSNVAQAATSLADDLENERDASALPLTSTGNSQDDTIRAAQQQTYRAQIAFNNVVNSINLADLPGGGTDITTTLKSLQKLPEIRKNAFPKGSNSQIQQTVSEYDYPIQQLISLTSDMAMGADNSSLITAGRALEQFSTAKEYASIQRAMLTAALATPDKKISSNDLAYLSHAKDQMDNSIQAFQAVMGSSESANILDTFQNNNNVKTADRYLQQVLDSGSLSGTQDQMSAQTWNDNASARITAMASDEQDLVHRLDLEAKQLRADATTQTVTSSVIIAIVLLVAVLGAGLVAQSMVRTLRRLQEAAEDVAQHRLPELVRTFSESDPQDVDVSVVPIGIESQDEIGHVARAFDQVHSEAVRLAAEQALLRGNINAMFTNLSRRSQGLIQRQISLISELESREADPDQLASLFKLDHLATRMRRNGENLLVLAGEDPGRRWTRPVPLVDVLRAAASEVEQYERIELASVPTADVIGRVVNDLVHLLAELLENATSFSSPQTRVRVTGHALPDGRVLVEIHDTGIGLSPDDLADINERLANPPVVDVSVSRRMGLFVVGRLSLRHGIRVQLRPSDSGGTTALVMLPVDITNAAKKRGGDQKAPGGAVPSAPGGPGAPGVSGAPANGLPKRGGGAAYPSPAGERELPTRGGGGGGLAAAFGGAASGRNASGGRESAPGNAGAAFGAEAPGRGANSGPDFGSNTGPNSGPGNGRELPTRSTGTPAETAGGLPVRGSGSAAGAGPSGPARAELPGRGNELTGRQEPQERPDGGAEAPGGPGELPRRGAAYPGSDAGRELPTRGGAETGTGWGVPQAPQQRIPEQAEQEWTRRVDPEPGPSAERSPWGEPTQHAAAGPDPRSPLPEVSPQNLPEGMRGSRYPGQEQNGGQEQAPDQRPDGTMQFPQFSRPQPPAPPVPQQAPQPQQARVEDDDDPLTGRALPAGGDSSGGTPIFEQMETTWFRTGRVDRMRSVHVSRDRQESGAQDRPQAEPQPQQEQRPAPEPNGATGTASWQSQQPQPAQQAPQSSPYDDTPWRPSANDDRWRRAEVARKPSSEGTTASGLPRRVPNANLVPGTAEASTLGGPQVDRSPEQVRGRLSSLRRGVQQGRMARGSGSGNGSGPYGPERQER